MGSESLASMWRYFSQSQEAWIWDQGIEMGEGPLTNTRNDELASFIPVPATLGPAALEVLVPEARAFPLENKQNCLLTASSYHCLTGSEFVHFTAMSPPTP